MSQLWMMFCFLAIFLTQVGYANATANQTPQIEQHILALPAKRALALSADDCVAEETKEGNRNSSILIVRLKIVGGRLAVDWPASSDQFKPSLLFQCRAGMISAGTAKARRMKLAIEKRLLAELDMLLLKQEQFVSLALPVGDSSSRPDDVPPPATLRESHDWKTYHKLYMDWNESRPDVIRAQFHPRLVFLDRVLNGSLKALLADTPIRAYFKDESDDDNPLNDKLDVVTGQITFHVNDPIGDLMQEQDYKITLPAQVTGVAGAEFIAPDRKQIARALAPLKGKFWRAKLVGSYLNDFFVTSRSGYQRIVGAITVSQAFVLPKQINIPPVPQIVRIVFYGTKDDGEIKTALRQILTDREFAVYTKKKSLPNFQIIKECPDKIASPGPANADPDATADTDQTIKISCRFVAYEDLGAKDNLPYLNANDLAQQQLALSALDWTMGPGRFTPDDESGNENNENTPEDDDDDANVAKFVELQINKRITAPHSANPAAPGTQASVGNPPASATDNVKALKPQLQQRCLNKPCLNFIGGELVYRPGQGIRFYGLYERKRILNGDISIRVGNFGGYIISGDGEWDYLFFNKLNHRLSFQIHGATDSTANRLFGAVETDERRTGGSFRAEYELLTNPALLTISFGGKRETVELTQNEKKVAKQNLTIFQTGLVFVMASKDVIWRRTIQLEPAFRFDPGLTPSQRGFGVFSMSGIFHQYLPGRRDFIVNGRVDVASKNTPLFEQPFLGGEDSVRGFRSDDAIGRRQWVLQHEYQFPVPGVKPESDGLLAMLRSRVQLAAFFDVGGIYRTTGSPSGTRFGSGLGVRFNYGPHVLKFDWAYGIGDSALGQGRGHGRFYFSVSREIPRLLRR